MKLVMLAVISRAFSPGTKFDYVLVLSGRQGIGKSTFFLKVCCNEELVFREFENDRQK